RLTANRTIALIEWDSLKLTAEEAAALLSAAHLQADAATVEALHDRSGGWAAGLVLLAEQWRRGGRIARTPDTDSLQQVFAYFAGQIFDRAAPEDRLLLLQLSYLPDMSERLATALTGSDAAGRLLEQLYRRHLFTDRRRGEETSYQFHALFRVFLQHRAESDLTADQRGVIARRAAGLLEAAGRPELALPLWVASGDFGAAEALVLKHAGPLIGQGRWKVVTDWMDALPRERVEGRAWLLHWFGTAQIGVNPPGARTVLERAYAQAVREGDRLCQVQVAAGMVEALFLEYNRFTPIDPWIPVLGMILEPDFSFGSLEQELRAQSALLISATYRMPDHPGFERCAQRVRDLLRAGLDVNLRVIAATHLCLYGAFTGHLTESAQAADMLTPLLDDPVVTVYSRIFAWAVIGWYAAVSGERELGRRAIDADQAIAREEGVHTAERFACIIGYFVDLDRGDFHSGEARIERFARIHLPDQPYEAASIVNMRGYHGLVMADPGAARDSALEAYRLYDYAGSIPHILVGLNCLVWACVESRDEPVARRWMAEHERWSSRRNMGWARWVLDAGEAVLALRRRDEAAVQRWLGEVFAVERHRFDLYAHLLSWSRLWSSRLAAAALERDIETVHVRHFIREFHLEAPRSWLEAWPLPIRIRALGSFEVSIDGAPLAFSGRAPRKPLAFLQRLICGDPAGVRDQTLIDALWPDEDGDAARDAFRVALHRLRKLLGHPEAVRSENGLVSLDPAVVWVDKFALQAAMAAAREDANAFLQACDWYRGRLLADEPDAVWSLTPRRQLEAEVVRWALELAERLEARGDGAGALHIAQQAFLTVPEAPRLAELLLRHLLESGRAHDAVDAHRQHLDARAPGETSTPALRQLYETALASPGKTTSVRDR
ncbi:MAG: hypothetical protein U1F52_22655, partial [Burkholderiales bacterium]